MSGGNWSVEITPGEIYGKLVDLEQRMIRAAGGVERLESALQTLSAADADRETRIRALENRRWPLASIGAVTAVIGALSGIVAFLIGSSTG